jgi:uncharacterized protein (DUF952 family)
MIYHIVSQSDWDAQSDSENYEAASLSSENFIHLCTKTQAEGVLFRYYQGATDLLMLHVDESKLTHELIFEEGQPGEMFPHLYGALNKSAVVEIEKIG